MRSEEYFSLRYQCQGCKWFYFTGLGQPQICRKCGETNFGLVVVKVYVESSPWYTFQWTDKETIEFVRPYLRTAADEIRGL